MANLPTISSRLAETRHALAYDLSQVSEATGISTSRLGDIEKAAVPPTGDELLILASFYNCDFRRILDESLPSPLSRTDILFRRFGSSFTPQDKRDVQEFLFLCEVEQQLWSVLDRHSPALPTAPRSNMFKEEGRAAAIQLRESLGYRENEVPLNVYADFRRLGVHLFRRKLSNPEISGLYIQDELAGHCILVNYNEDLYRQRFSAAHEFAHALFDSADGVVLSYVSSSSKYNKNDLQEIRANAFASEYLIPSTMLRALPQISADNVVDWAQKFKVSTTAFSFALTAAGLVSPSAGAELRRRRVPLTEKVDPEAPEGLNDLQRSRRIQLMERGLSAEYVHLCFEAFQANAISLGRLCEALRVSRSELAETAKLFGQSLHHGL